MPGMPTSNASVHVTAGGAIYHRCKVKRWATGQVRVKCFDASNDPVQSQFYLSYDELSQFGEQRLPRTLLTAQECGGAGGGPGGAASAAGRRMPTIRFFSSRNRAALALMLALVTRRSAASRSLPRAKSS